MHQGSAPVPGAPPLPIARLAPAITETYRSVSTTPPRVNSTAARLNSTAADVLTPGPRVNGIAHLGTVPVDNACRWQSVLAAR
jgi:hypothetical protein